MEEEEIAVLDTLKLSKWDAPSWDREPNILWIGDTPDVEIGFTTGSGKLCCWHCEEMGCRDEACDWVGAKLDRPEMAFGICCWTDKWCSCWDC
jgi:hypothetical protein